MNVELIRNETNRTKEGKKVYSFDFAITANDKEIIRVYGCRVFGGRIEPPVRQAGSKWIKTSEFGEVLLAGLQQALEASEPYRQAVREGVIVPLVKSSVVPDEQAA